MDKLRKEEYIDMEDLEEIKSRYVSVSIYFIIVTMLITFTILYLNGKVVEKLEVELDKSYSYELTTEETKKLKGLMTIPFIGKPEVTNVVSVNIVNKYTKSTVYTAYLMDNKSIITDGDEYFVLDTHKLEEVDIFVQIRNNK